jgi:[ribosomal protein S5]-alanine N-acetyltransferase
MSKLLPPNHNVLIEGATVIMRPIEMQDIGEQYTSWLNNPEINEFLEVSSHKEQTVDDIVEYVNFRRLQGTEVFGIFTKKEKLFVGTTGLINWEDKAEFKEVLKMGLIQRKSDCTSPPLGFGLMIGDKMAQMFGVGGEVYLYMISFIFDCLNTDMIFNLAVENHREVITMADRVEFKKVHLFRDHVQLSDGKYDGVALSMTKDEWTIKKKKFKILLNRFNINFNS